MSSLLTPYTLYLYFISANNTHEPPLIASDIRTQNYTMLKHAVAQLKSTGIYFNTLIEPSAAFN